MATYYASPAGGGTGASSASPFQIASFISLPPNPGDTLNLLDGIYTGANSMISAVGVNGSVGNLITIQAINEGSVTINGQGARTPISLNNCDYWKVASVKFHNSNGPAAYIYQSDNVWLYRCLGWDAATGNYHVISFDGSSDGLIEQCAAWGRGRKMMEFFNGADNTGRMCWARKSFVDGGGGTVFEMSYSSTGTTWENCIGTWAKEGGGANVGGHGGIFGWTGASSGADDSKLLGSIAYIRGSDIVNIDTGLVMQTSGQDYQNPDGIDVVAYVEPGTHSSVRPFSMNNSTNNSLTNITSIGGAAGSFADWTVSNHNDSDSTVSIWTGTGATVGYRYVNRTLGTTPMWPHPLDQYLKDALAESGYQSVTFGFDNDTGLLTDAIEEMFGSIPGIYYEGGEDLRATATLTFSTGATLFQENMAATASISFSADVAFSVPPESPPSLIGDVSSGREWHTLCKIFLDTGTQYYSKKDVEHPAYVYEGRIKSFGYVDRSIPVPSGLPQLSDCLIQVIDTDMALRDVLAHQTPRRRLLELRNVPEGGHESSHPPFAIFEIYDFELHDALVEIHGRDINFSWIDKPIPGLINRTNFPDLKEGIDEAFMPIISGVLDAPDPSDNPQGVLTLPRMTLRRWGLAQHPILYVELCGRTSDDELFALIPPGDYTITEEVHIIDGISYTLSFIDFDSDQDEALEVRLRIVEGFYTRGAFGDMPAVINSPLTALRNPVDMLINVIYATLATETRIPRFNTDSFEQVHALLDTEFIDYTSPGLPYACDGAITEPITMREFLAQFLTSFELDMYVNRYGQIELSITHEEDPDRPVFSQGPVFGEPTDNSLILLNSVRQRAANPTCNRLRYNYLFNYATGEFAGKAIFDNEDDQSALGGPSSPPIPFIEEETVEFRWVRVPEVATDVARRRMEFLALGSYRIEKKLPLPITYQDLELAKLIGVTTQWGLEIGGYHNVEIKTTGLTYELDSKTVTVRGIRRVPQTVDQTEEQPLEFSGDTYIEAIDLGLGSATSGQSTYARSLFYLPNNSTGAGVGYEEGTEYFIELHGSNADGVSRTVSVTLVLDQTTEPITLGAPQTLSIPAGFNGRIRSVINFFPDDLDNLWLVQMPLSTGANTVLLYTLRIMARQTEVTSTVSEIQLSNSSSATALDQTIGGGDIARTTSNGPPATTTGFVTASQPRWTYHAESWDSISLVRFWVVVANASFDLTTRWSEVILYDVTASAYLEASRVICDNPVMFLAPRLFDVTFDVSALTDGHTYDVHFRSVEDGAFSDFNTYFHKARLVLYISDIFAAEFYARCGRSASPASGEIRTLLPAFTPESSMHFEASSSAGIATLRDLGTNDTGDTGSDIEEVLIGSSGIGRTPDITNILTVDNRYTSSGILQAGIVVKIPPGEVGQNPEIDTQPRIDFLQYLTDQGFTPVRAFTFDEGTGTPVEHYTSATALSGGTPTWSFNATYGVCGLFNNTNDNWSISDSGWHSTTAMTIICIHRKTDTTARLSELFAVNTLTAANRCQARVPDETSNIKIFFGGVSAPNTLTVAHAPHTNIESFVMRAGTLGSSIWINGSQLTSQATLITRSATTTDDTNINAGNSVLGDLREMYFICWIPAEVSDAVLAQCTVDNILLGF